MPSRHGDVRRKNSGDRAGAANSSSNPLHPYTRGLLASLPAVEGEKLQRLPTIPGNVPSILDLPTGCKFETRCPDRFEKCVLVEPELIEHRAGPLGPLPPGEPVKILEVQNLRVRFPVAGGVFARKVAEVRAVDGVSFDARKGRDAGPGRRIRLRQEHRGPRHREYSARDGVRRGDFRQRFLLPELSPATAPRQSPGKGSSGGKVDLAKLDRAGMRPYRADIQMIFQDPYSSLNPRMTVGQIVEEPMTIHTRLSRAERKDRVGWLLSKVGFTTEQVNRYPHEFSGGQRQRIGIARALATNPKIVIADEPVSALDVSIQAQVVNLMQDLQEEFGLSYIFIAHDLSVVRHISNRIAVMYLGNIVEIGPAELIYKNPMHPYSRALLSRGAASRSRHHARRAHSPGRRRAESDPQAVRGARSTRAARSRDQRARTPCRRWS